MDEPTSGLDAAAAQNVINVLRDLSNRGMTVMATLHQPRSSIMVKFDQLMVLSEGSMVFSGPRGAYGAYLEADLKCSVPVSFCMRNKPFVFVPLGRAVHSNSLSCVFLTH